MENNSNLTIFKSLSRLIFYTILAMGLFFGIALVIFFLRSRDEDDLVMQEIQGKYYIDVHNDLTRSRLHVELSRRSFPDRPPGIILYQSIPAGKTFLPGDKITLVVNQPEPILLVPNLKGTPLEGAKVSLNHLNYQDDVYSLKIGAITEYPTDEVPPGTILQQFPLPDSSVSPEERVYLLVAAHTSGQESGALIPEETMEGQNITILANYFHKLHQDYRIEEIKKPDHFYQNGEVYSVKRGGNGVYKLGVYFKPASHRFEEGYELLNLELSGKEQCEVERSYLDKKAEKYPIFEEEKDLVFRTSRHSDGEEVKLLFYRRGAVQLTTLCGGESAQKTKIKPDKLG